MITKRSTDGSAGDANYGVIGRNYTTYRQPDPSIARQIHRALGDARRVLNVGAGAGSYEPVDREVAAVEPSASMRAQRPVHLVRAIDAVAESLPFADKTFDAAMGAFTMHQWQDLEVGLREVRRVTRGPIVLMSNARELGAALLAERLRAGDERDRGAALSRGGTACCGAGQDRHRAGADSIAL